MHGTLNAPPRSGAVPGSQAVQGKSGTPAVLIVYQRNYYIFYFLKQAVAKFERRQY